MPGLPNYPDDWATRIRSLERQVRDLFTAANTRVGLTKILAKALSIGGDAAQRIELDATVEPQIRLYPGEAADPSVVYATVSNDPDGNPAATLLLKQRPNIDGLNSMLMMYPFGAILARISDVAGPGWSYHGGFVIAVDDFLRLGYRNGTANDNYMLFNQDGRTHHIGEWGYFSSAETGLLMAHTPFAGTLGTAGATVTYGHTLATAPRPLAILNDTPAAGQYAAGLGTYDHTTTGFGFRGTKDSNGDFGLVWWAFRT